MGGPGGENPAPRGLSVVATPIGNLGDITLRGLDILRDADVIACEDTRITKRLLARYGIDTPLFPYHDHNADRAGPALIKRLQKGDSVALVSDAGTPLISDPGYRLVRACTDRGIPVTTAPGASSVLAALTLSGLPTDRFLFIGFLPPRATARRKALAAVAEVSASLVVMESARRLAAALDDMVRVLGPRQAAVMREMTKMYEEARRAPLADLARHYRQAGAPKGEVTIVIAPPAGKAPLTDTELDRLLRAALAEASVRDAAARVAQATGLSRRRVYARALVLAGNKALAEKKA